MAERTCANCGASRRLELDTLACPCKPGARSEWSVVKPDETCGKWRSLSQRNGAKKAKGTYEPPIPTEEQEQQRIIEWCNLNLKRYPALEWIFAIPNGGKRNKPEAFRFKTAGVKRGVPDMCLPVPRGQYSSLFIELKRTKGGTLSHEQAIWIEALNSNGCRAVVCKGAQEAIAEIENYLRGGNSE
jgi:hypothetical protein